MTYVKQTFIDDETVLTAAHLQHIEDGIKELEREVANKTGEDGEDGQDGKDGFSPIARVTQTETGATIAIQDSKGTTTAEVRHGTDGKDGSDGQDGYTPQKGVDYFDGKDGVSVTVENISESTSDGGNNVVTFSDGKTLTIKNGSTGAEGIGIKTVNQTVTGNPDGGTNEITVTLTDGTKTTFQVKNGVRGATGGTGAEGVGIKSVQQTTTSTADGGVNIITVRKTDDTTSTFQVKNGSKGSKGDPGSDASVTSENIKTALGYTPANQETVNQLSEEIGDLTDLVNSMTGDDSGYETVNSVAEMTDKTKSYILSSTGTLWSWMTKEVIVPTTASEQIKSTSDNLAKTNSRLTSTKSADYVSSGTGYITSPYIFLDDYVDKGEITLKMGGGKQWIYEKSSDAPSYTRVLMTDANNDSVALISNVSPNATWKDDSTKTTTFDGSDVTVKINLPYYYNSKEVKRLRFSTSGSDWADGDITVEYTDYEMVMGEPDWQDTGLAVAEITEYSLANASVKNFMEKVDYSEVDYTKSSITTYCGNEYYRKDYPLPITLTWNDDRMAVDYAVALTDATSGATETHYAETNRITIYNLKPNKSYRYKVTALMCNGVTKTVKEGNFTTLSGTRMLKIDGIQNIRDVGGYTAQDGKKVKYGLIYRGSAMDEEIPRHLCISEVGKREMLMLGIGTDLDLRSAHSESPLGVDYVNTASGYDNYDGCFKIPTQRTNFANLLASIVTQLQENKPVYIHCQGGCDRTGTLVFQLLGLLGVSESDLAKEYELSSFSPIGYTRTRNSEKYTAMIARVNAYSGSTINEKLYNFATKQVDSTETGGCGIDPTLITTFRELVLG